MNKGNVKIIHMKRASRTASCAALFGGAALLVLAGMGTADLVMDDINGRFSDSLGDSSGLDFLQNAVVGPAYTPGARLALTSWSWSQSYTPASDAVNQPFSATGARFNMTQAIKDCVTCYEMVGLWQRTFFMGRDFRLGLGAVSTTYYDGKTGPEPGEASNRYIMVAGIEKYNDKYVASGLHETDLVLGEPFTVTYRASFCDDPCCGGGAPCIPNGMIANNAQIARYEVWLGSDRLETRDVCVGKAPLGGFYMEGIFTSITLEPDWPDPLPVPSKNNWEFRVMATMTTTGGSPCYSNPPYPNCSPACTGTLWLASVKVMAKGHRVSVTCWLTQAECDVQAGGPGILQACNCQCIPVLEQCGWDATTYYVGSGSYVSPVFDSLSEKTVWENMWWNIDQNGDEYPPTPVALKWRVGNTPNPDEWLGNPDWYMWTIPFTVTQTAVTLFPPPMQGADSVTLYHDGAPAVGRYFQYEADLTSQFNNYRSPPEMDPNTNTYERDQHDARSPFLRFIRVFYRPVRGMVLSRLIAPARLRKWKSVFYEADLANGGTVKIDILDSANRVLFASIPNLAGGFSLASLNPSRYPAIRLRAWLDSDADPAKRPVLKQWAVDWEVNADPLRLDCNSIAPARGEQCAVFVNLNGDRDGSLTVHDAAGQLVKVLCRCSFPAGVSTFAWKGVNEKGQAVAPGVYFVSLDAKDINSVKRLVVR